ASRFFSAVEDHQFPAYAVTISSRSTPDTDLPMPAPTTLDVPCHKTRSATFLRHPCYYAYLLPVRVTRSATPHVVNDHTGVRLARLASPGSVWAVLRRYGYINPLSIDYACRPRLRSRLTQGGLTWPWNPWSFGGRGSHPSFATHACILTRVASTTRSPCRFTPHTTLPYPLTLLDHPPLRDDGLEHTCVPQLRRCT